MDQTPESDSQLAIRCQLGDPQAWEELVQRWHPPLWRFLLGMLGDHSAAEDLLQTVWLRIIRSLIQLQDHDRLGAWLYQVARRAVADRLREQYRQPQATELVEIPVADSALERLELSEAVASALTQLHPLDREATVLFYLRQFSLDEVAEICQVPSGTIKSRLHRSRRTLRPLLENLKGIGHDF